MKMLTQIYKEDKDALKEYLMSRTQDLSTDVLVTVSNIIQDVKNNKDEACLKYTKQFDKVLLDSMEVKQEELDMQISKCDKDLFVRWNWQNKILRIFTNFKNKMDIYFKKKWESI